MFRSFACTMTVKLDQKEVDKSKITGADPRGGHGGQMTPPWPWHECYLITISRDHVTAVRSIIRAPAQKSLRGRTACI